METSSKRYVLYGLTHYRDIIDSIVKEVGGEGHYYDLRLILTEALNNAFSHGNRKDTQKPIFLKYRYDGSTVRFEVEDCGEGCTAEQIKRHISEDSILEESGRGLFLIRSFSDRVRFERNKLIMEKKLR